MGSAAAGGVVGWGKGKRQQSRGSVWECRVNRDAAQAPWGLLQHAPASAGAPSLGTTARRSDLCAAHRTPAAAAAAAGRGVVGGSPYCTAAPHDPPLSFSLHQQKRNWPLQNPAAAAAMTGASNSTPLSSNGSSSSWTTYLHYLSAAAAPAVTDSELRPQPHLQQQPHLE